MPVRKMSYRMQLIGYPLFTLAILLNSLPAYREGLNEIKNEENLGNSTFQRKCGFYCLVAGYTFIVLVGRGKIS